MIPLFLPSQVQAMDARAFERGVDPAALMDLAAGHLARGVLRVADRRHGLRVALVCGKGNNGGDGIAAARHLAARGASPTVVLVTAPEELGDDAARELVAWRRQAGRVVVATDGSAIGAALVGADVAVDCLLGTGATGEPRGVYGIAVAALNGFDGPVVACDIPTGVDGATGRVPGVAVDAQLTVTLGAHKRGLWLPPGAELVGELVLGEIGVQDGQDAPAARVLEPADLPRVAPVAAARAHKRSRGVVTVYAGAPGTAGAAILCARAALAGGAGLVTVATPQAVAPIVAGAVPEAMTLGLPDDVDGIIDAIGSAMERADVLAMGPGLGLAPGTQHAVRRLVATVERPIVLDADGLNAFRDHRDQIGAHACEALVMTPHAQELGRLTGLSGHGVHARRADLAAEKAAEWGATVVAKGPGTVIAAPDGRVWINATGSPALATGGTGDVLTGVTAALVAQQPGPPSVAAAVHLHGLAGDLAGRAVSIRATTAGTVIEHLGAAALERGI
ncbi:NAD(P)H-hydrate dehydratase [Euzebya sp.]|uniref:NAD(P)H-hydrate dehydratase n=1 Tax=Euzebya sp. TaxID=1971409 RepID=UPI00351316D2